MGQGSRDCTGQSSLGGIKKMLGGYKKKCENQIGFQASS